MVKQIFLGLNKIIQINKTTIIIAAGSGIGTATARKLAADGYHVGILSSSGKGEVLAQELGGVGVTGTNQSQEDIQKLVDLVMERWGRAAQFYQAVCG